MEEKVTLEALNIEIFDLVSHRNKLKGWVFYIREYLQNRDLLNDDDPLRFDANELFLIQKYGLFSEEFAAVVAKALMNKSFILFVIKEIGIEPMYEIAWNPGATEGGYIEGKYKIKVYKQRGYNQSYTEKFKIFQNNLSYHDSDYLSLTVNIKNVFRSYFNPPNNYFPITQKVENEGKFVRYTSEVEIFDTIPRVIHNLQLGILKRGASGTILKAGLNSLKKDINLPEIFPKDLHKKTNDFALLGVIQMVDDLGQLKPDGDVIRTLKGILDEVCYSDVEMYNHLMRIYNGNKTGVYVSDNCEPYIDALRAHTNGDEWVDPSDFFVYLNYRRAHLIPINTRYGKLKLPLQNNIYRDTIEVDFNNLYELFLKPYNYGVLYFFASLGLVETLSSFGEASIDIVSYRTPDKINMPYNGLSYFRLTKLGRHVLGVDKSYDAPETAFKPVEVMLSEDNLTITLSEKNDTLAKELSGYCNRLGDRFFQVTAQSFLNKISRKSQLVDRIENLKIIVANTPSGVWTTFFKTLDQKFDPLERVKGSFVLFKLPADNSKLMSNLMTDHVLRSLYTKVDGRQVLVKKKDLPQFAKRMLTHGWVMADYVFD